MHTNISIKINRIALWLARVLGYVYHWLGNGWRPPIFWLALITLIVWLNEHLFNLKSGTWFNWWKILSLYMVLLLLWWAWQARKRLVVEEFVDYTSDPPKSVAKGLSTLLVVELVRLRELYRAVDEQRPISTATGYNPDKTIEPTIKLEDIKEFLKSAVTAESKLSLGPFQIPIGTLMALLGRLAQGPRIIGGLHKDNDRFILTAQMIGGKQLYSWRVDDPKSLVQASDKGIRSLDDMLAELTCRIFTDLALTGSFRWRATWTFSQGLRAYRDCLCTPIDRKLKLRRTERNFVETLAEDKTFNLAFYNLGVVYTELGQDEAAERAFSKAIEKDPNQGNAYYALALNLFRRKQHDSVIRLCEHVIALKPNNAKAYHLKGLAQREHQGKDSLKDAILSRQKAVEQSWRTLCISELKGGSAAGVGDYALQRMRTIARDCSRDLAVAYFFQAKEGSGDGRRIAFIQAEAMFRQALSLDRYDASLHFELGKTYHEWEKYDRAIREYESAIQIAPNNSEFWAYLALALAIKGNKVSTLSACEKVLNCTSGASPDALKWTAEAYNKLGETDQSQRVSEIKGFLRKLEEDVAKGDTLIPELEKSLQDYEKKGNREWEYAQVVIALGRLHLVAANGQMAQKYFGEAIGKLSEKHPLEIRWQGLRAFKAASLRSQGKHAEALQEAEQALQLDPLGFFERKELGQVYFALKDFEHARAAWESALLIEPDDPEIHTYIGVCYVNLALNYRDATQRSESLKQATKYLGQALDLYPGNQTEGKAGAHYWLGRLHYMLSEPEKAITHFGIAQTLILGNEGLVVTCWLGWVYLDIKAYDACEEQFLGMIEEANKLPASDKAVTNMIVGSKIRDLQPLGEVLATAYLRLAYSYAERDANLKQGLDLAEKAEQYISGLSDKSAKVRSQAALLDCKGWILYKQRNMEDAIKSLEEAVSMVAHAGAYWHLAMACEGQLQECEDKKEQQRLITNAKAYCQHAREIDIDRKYSQRVSDLLLRLQGEGQQTRVQEQKQPEPALNTIVSTLIK